VADVVKNEGTTVIFGRDYIEEELLGLTFKITAFSFFQTNSLGAEVLYSKAREYVGATKDKVIFDLYSGTGTIAQILAPVAKNVVGVEIVPEAVEAAKINAHLNGLNNCEFIADDVLTALDNIEKTPDFIVLDPPRDGIHPKALEKIINYGVDSMVYISCKPTSLARDLITLQSRGYMVSRCCCVDMFPGTGHVETVVLLSHKKPDGHINVKVEFGEGEGKVPLDNIAKRAEEYKPKERVTYKMIKEYIETKYGFKVHTAYIAEVKKDLGLPMYDAPNAVEELKQPRKHPTPEKVEAIKDALKHFEVI
jgi:16S rRNA G966 N2-methylase RsmD